MRTFEGNSFRITGNTNFKKKQDATERVLRRRGCGTN